MYIDPCVIIDQLSINIYAVIMLHCVCVYFTTKNCCMLNIINIDHASYSINNGIMVSETYLPKMH